MPVPLEKRIGRFELIQIRWNYNLLSSDNYEIIDIGVREIDFVKENNVYSHFDGMPVRGIMTAKDESLMTLKGSFDTAI